MSLRKLSIIVFSLYFSWLLAFPFQGQVLFTLAARFGLDITALVIVILVSHFTGLISSHYFVRSMYMARKILLFSIAVSIMVSVVFFFQPSILWNILLPLVSFLAGISVAAWSFFFRCGTPRNDRIKTAADGIIFSNLLMILMNTTAVLISPYVGLGLSILMLGGAFYFTKKLPKSSDEVRKVQAVPSAPFAPSSPSATPAFPVKPLVFLCIFIMIITINSGLMYQVINPAFAHLDWLVSWYWAVPYIGALVIVRNLSRKSKREYTLFVGITMIGFSFIAFLLFDRSAASYLVIDTLILGAYGIFDLFWWSILGEMLEYCKNPSCIMGVGLSSNVLGVLLGVGVGNKISSMGNSDITSSMIALVVVFVILLILPLLNQTLTKLLKDHAFLNVFTEMVPVVHEEVLRKVKRIDCLTERENEIAAFLMRGRTYKMIASELYLSENTIKTHIKNIYSKLGVTSKVEMIKVLMEQENFDFVKKTI